jgi:Phenylalanyl-tRNA synthetase beta subunit
LVAANLIKKICGGTISKKDIQIDEKFKNRKISFPVTKLQSITGFKVSEKEIIKILDSLGFKITKKKNFLDLVVPSWRPDIDQEIDIVEEVTRIIGYDKIKTELPEKVRIKPTLNKQQKLFHFLQRSVAS